MSMTPGDLNNGDLPSPHSLGQATETLKARWGWFFAYGLLCVLFGVAALIMTPAATAAVVVIIAVMLIVAGGAEIVLGFSSRDWPTFFLWVISGLFYLVFGAFALAQPLAAAAALTVFVGVGFVVAGLARIWMGWRLPDGHRAFIVFAGAVTTLLGAMILAGWPGDTLIILGTLFGIDMVFYGASWAALALKLRR